MGTADKRTEPPLLLDPCEPALHAGDGLRARITIDRTIMTTLLTMSPAETELRRRAGERILVLDGAMGTEIQGLKLGEAGYRGTRFADWPSDLRGNNDILILSQPDAVRELHLNYLRAGAGRRVDPRRRAPRQGSGRHCDAGGWPAALHRRRDRPDQSHRLDLAR